MIARGDSERDLESNASNASQLRKQVMLLADFGRLALQGLAMPDLFGAAARIAADGSEAQFSKILRFVRPEGHLLVCAGVGWSQGVVGRATVGADLASPAGFALRTGKPVISNDLGSDKRFRTPELLVEHGATRAINAIIREESGNPFGVVEVDSRRRGEFSEHDIMFLQAIANVLGLAIERDRTERAQKDTFLRQKLLVDEVNHRVKNSLQTVAALLNMHAHSVESEELREHLGQASKRVIAVARAHDRIHQYGSIQAVDLGVYLTDICTELGGSATACGVHLDVPSGLEVAIEKAIPIALLVSELVMNASKHAYPSQQDCPVWVVVTRAQEGGISVIVRDEGTGLPAGFDTMKKGLGMRIVAAFTQQLGAELIVRTSKSGSEFTITMPQILNS